MADGVSKVERVLNVLAILLDTNRFLSRAEITTAVSGYPPGDIACRRTFERDKETLRAMGVPILTQVLADGVDIGYRVRPSDYFLADLGLSDDEAAALQLAVSAVALDRHAGAGALLKLSGARTTGAPIIAALPVVPALATLFDGIRQRAVLQFTYRGRARVVEPWALRSTRGRWYLVALDRDAQERRTFRADRIDGDVSLHDPGTVTLPDEIDVGDAIGDAPWELGDGASTEVTVAFDPPHHLGALERLGRDAVAVELPDGRVAVTFGATSLDAVRSFVLGFLDHAEVLSPPTFRQTTIDWLRSIVSSGSGVVPDATSKATR